MNEGTCAINSAKIAVIGSFVVTIGDLLSTYAAVLAVEEGVAADAEQARQFQAIQQQLDDIKSTQLSQCQLQAEIDQMKAQQDREQLQLILEQLRELTATLAPPHHNSCGDSG